MYDRNRYLSATLQIHLPNSNTTIMAYVVDPNGALDYQGAVYYVIVVVLIYALSIVMMIASHIRKNQQDSQLRTYLKEMAVLRKNDKREKIMGRIGTFTKTALGVGDSKGSNPHVKSTSGVPHGNQSAEATSLVSPADLNRKSPTLVNAPARLSTNGNSDLDSTKKSMKVFCNSPKRSYLPNISIQVIDENTSL